MLWSKQFYYFDLEKWLAEHKSGPLMVEWSRKMSGFTCSTRTSSQCLDKWDTPGRGVGFGVPHHLPGTRRFRLRQGAAAADAAQPVLSP